VLLLLQGPHSTQHQVRLQHAQQHCHKALLWSHQAASSTGRGSWQSRCLEEHAT
jgi:hypothetical protein